MKCYKVFVGVGLGVWLVEVEVGGCEGLWWCCGDEWRGRGVDV